MQDNFEHFPETQSHEETLPGDNIPEQTDQQQQQSAQEESSKDRNFRQLREKTERLERERDEQLRYIQSLQAQAKQQKDDSLDLADDDLVERKHVDRIVDNKIKKYEQQMQQYEQLHQEQAILNQYQDYKSIVNDETIAKLVEQEPELAATLGANTDFRSKAIATYNVIKRMGIAGNAQPQPYADDVARIQRNASKPKPLASVNPQQGDSPLSRANAFANGLTDELKDQLRKEMNDSRRGY